MKQENFFASMSNSNLHGFMFEVSGIELKRHDIDAENEWKTNLVD